MARRFSAMESLDPMLAGASKRQEPPSVPDPRCPRSGRALSTGPVGPPVGSSQATSVTRPRLPAWLLVAALASSAAWPAAAGVPVMSFNEVEVGMKGVGRTVFRGVAVEEFGVEIVGTMENVLPKKNLILGRLQGGPLAETGVMEGMSGSPVYIAGRLVGAVSYSWAFAKEPICGITPIEEMLEMLDRGMDFPAGVGGTAEVPARSGEPGSVSLLAWPERIIPFLRSRQRRLAAGPGPLGSLSPLRPTLALSGYDLGVARDWFPDLEAMSLRPVMSGSPGPRLGAATPTGGDASGAPLTAGSSFGVTLVRGDLEITAIGTVTYAAGDDVLGFGHPMLSLGRTAMPMTRAYVFGHFPSLAASFKLAGPLEEVGAIVQDRFPGVAGRKGATVPMVPVRVEMDSGGGQSRSYRFDIVPDPLLTPGLLHMSLLSLLSAEQKDVGDLTLRLREGSRIQLSEGLEVKLDNLFSGDMSALYASGTVAYMTYLLMNNEDRPAGIEGINLLLGYEDARRTARIEKIWLERYSVKPGEEITLHVSLQPFRGALVTEAIPLKIPQEAPEGKTLLQVGDSLTLSRMETTVGGGSVFFPRSLEHLVWLLNNIRANQKVYATLIRPDTGALISGERLPNLPPSISSVLLPSRGEQDSSARLRFRALLEASAETPHAVRGYQKLVMEIRR